MSLLRLIFTLLLLLPASAWAATRPCDQFPAAQDAAASRRVALIVQNSGYQFAGELDNPAYDAALVKTALGNIGFAVTMCADRSHQDMIEDLTAFQQAADDADVALIYFAGHGIRVGSMNWLLPVNFNLDGIREEEDFALYSLSHRAMIGKLGRAKTRIIVLDACRNNPFEQAVAARIALASRAVAVASRAAPAVPNGLAAVEENDVLVMFSAAAGQFAQDGLPEKGSPFANAFAAEIQRSGTELRLVAGRILDAVIESTGGDASRSAQRPYTSNSLGGTEVFLNGAPARAVPIGEEAAAFATCNSQWTGECWQAFVRRFPDGTNIRTAKLVLASFATPARNGSDSTSAATAALAAMTAADWSAGDHLALRARLVAVHGRDTIDALVASGDPRAAWIAAGAYQYSLAGYPLDKQRARKLFEVSAAAKFGPGLASLGVDFQYGENGERQDFSRALDLYRASAAQGYASGQHNLAIMYRDGSGVPPDEIEALRLFQLAAAQGYAAADANIGDLVLNGRAGLQADPVEAVKLFKRAADKGNANGQFYLAKAYSKGIGGLPISPQEFERLLRLAIEQHDDSATVALGYAYDTGKAGIEIDKVKARHLFKKAADEGDETGQYNLAIMMFDGEGGPVDLVGALVLFQNSAAQGFADSTAMLGLMTEFGEGGLTEDLGKAMTFYREAAAAGSTFAQEQLQRLGEGS